MCKRTRLSDGPHAFPGAYTCVGQNIIGVAITHKTEFVSELVG